MGAAEGSKVKESRVKNKTLRKRLITYFLIGLVPLSFIAIFFGIRTANDNSKALVKSFSYMIDAENAELEEELKSLSADLTGVLIDNVSFMTVSNKKKDEYNYRFEMYLLRRSFADLLKNRKYDSAMLFYNPKEDMSVVQFTESRSVESVMLHEQARSELLSYVYSLPGMENQSYYVWKPRKIGNHSYLVFTVSREKCYLCCFVSIDSILTSITREMGAYSEDGDIAMLTDRKLLYSGTILESTEYSLRDIYLQNLQLVRIPSFRISNALCYYEDNTQFENRILFLLGQRYYWQSIIFQSIWPLLILLGSTGLILGIVLFFVNRNVIKPLERITESIENLDEEHIGEGITCDSDLTEYNQMTDTFNLLTDKMRRLRIDVYEEKLQRRNAELNYYKQQIDSHFFSNCLNIIMNLAIIGDTDAIENMSRELANYIRQAFNSDALLGSLDEEISCIRSFLKIQQIRFSNRFDFTIDVDEDLRGVVIPPILILTFVENSVKYAVAAEGRMHLCIKAELRDGKRVFIGIYDNGSGFPEEVLSAVKNEKPFIDKNGKHIGIENAIQRLNIMYGKRKEIRIFNRPEGGAAVELELPYVFPDFASEEEKEA